MQSHERMLGILDLFDLGNPEWTVEELNARLGMSRSTLYRYLKTLSDAGFLTSFAGRGYTLGPRVTELDYQMITTDPLIRAARPVMTEMVKTYGGISLLCRRYKQRVLCVHQETATAGMRSNYERGKSRPLLAGAASLAILAYFSNYQLTKLYEEQAADFAAAGLGESLQAVRDTLKQIRQRGWVSTEGQVTKGVTGIASPVLDAKGDVVGSLSLTLAQTGLAEERIAAVSAQVVFCARILSKSLL